MTKCANLRAVGIDDAGRAARVRDVITSLGCEKHRLILRDVAVAVRNCDGSLPSNGEPLPEVSRIHRGAVAHFLAGLALGAPPLTPRPSTPFSPLSVPV
jgi:hypothetical protein